MTHKYRTTNVKKLDVIEVTKIFRDELCLDSFPLSKTSNGFTRRNSKVAAVERPTTTAENRNAFQWVSSLILKRSGVEKIGNPNIFILYSKKMRLSKFQIF